MPLYQFGQVDAAPFFAAFVRHIVGVGPWIAYDDRLDDRPIIGFDVPACRDHNGMARIGT